MSSPLLLGANVDRRDEELGELKAELSALKERNIDIEAEITKLRRDNARAITALRRQLTPLYQALQMVFGELDAISGDEPQQSQSAPVKDARWESWKQRLPGRPAEMIDLLLLHDSMSVKNLMAAMHCGKDAVYQAASKLGQAGIVQNIGGRYSLKK